MSAPSLSAESPERRGTSPGLPSGDQDQASPEPRGRVSQLHSKSSSNLLSDVYQGIRKAIPARDESGTRLGRNTPSRLNLRPLSPAAQPAPGLATAPLSAAPSASQRPQHARNLSLQDSLHKPLPEPPPPSLSPASPSTPLASLINIENSLDAISEQPRPETRAEGTLGSMDPNTSKSTTQSYSGGVDLSSSQINLPKHDALRTEAHSDSSMAPRTNNGSFGAGQSPPPVNVDGSHNNHSHANSGHTNANTTNPTTNTASTSTKAPSSTPATTAPSSGGSSAHLSGLMCNVHRTTGREPHPLVGATTTILGDKLYVFGGRILSRSRPAPLTADLYELDLIKRHWTKLDTQGDVPPPRYFHSMCALGDTKMVCYGGMSPTTNHPPSATADQQPEVTVMSDIYIYDVTTNKWTYVPSTDAPQGRYAHCACILPSGASFSSNKAPLSALQHNPPSANPNEGRIGISIDGTGGAEMVVVGGQDGANHYIEQISVFNLRSLKWTSTQSLGKSCGAYRSVVAPVPAAVNAKLGKAGAGGLRPDGSSVSDGLNKETGASMLIYSNYNFLDVKLELQIRGPDGALAEKPMSGTYSPPGLRFPNGGVIDTHFVVSGTYLTSSKQEYALWALDLRTLTWSRIDAGGSVFSQGSWNRGVLWNRRNTFVILGNRKRSLVDDYNHRRINFSNVCMVELEAFGFYDNPRKTSPLSGFVSVSSPYAVPGLSVARKAGWSHGGRAHSRAAEELGEKALGLRELSDMDLLCIDGQRIPVNSRVVGRRWGPYFVQLLREGAASQDGSDLRTGMNGQAGTRMSTMTITQANRNTGDSSMSLATTLANSSAGSIKPPSTMGTSISGTSGPNDTPSLTSTPTPASLPPNSRPRCLYLPHTYLTVQALLHFLYTSNLAPASSPLCTPQILCSLLQIARPYKVDGLLEAVVERLHALLDSRNAAAVFNATAMAAGGGRGIDGSISLDLFAGPEDTATPGEGMAASDGRLGSVSQADEATRGLDGLRINTGVSAGRQDENGEVSATASVSGSEWGSEAGDGEREAAQEVWNGQLSSVIGLQKRGLRGLMEGRRMRATVDRERGDGVRSSERHGGSGADRPGQRVGLGIGNS